MRWRAAGHDVIVLEARDRVGGRVHSVPFAGGLVERGAEFVFDGHEQVHALCARFGLTLADKGFPYGDREPRGGVPTTRAEVVAAAAGLERRRRRGRVDRGRRRPPRRRRRRPAPRCARGWR